MFIASLVLLGTGARHTFHQPTYFIPVFLGLFLLGAVAWLVAAVLGFARARAFGPSAQLVFVCRSLPVAVSFSVYRARLWSYYQRYQPGL